MASGLYLAGTTDTFEVVTTAAATVDVYATFVDWLAGAITPGSPQVSAITTATTTTVVASPAASTIREVKALHIRNKHASLATDVTVQLDRSGTNYEIHEVTLNAGEALEYTEATGWFTFAPAAKLDMLLRVTSNSVHATAATFADVTGLTCPVISGRTYGFDACLIHIGNATTTGAQFAIGGVAMTSMAAGVIDVTLNHVTTPTFSAGVATAINTAASVETTGSATNAVAYFAGFFTPSASGTFAIRATSEVTVGAGLTILAGSWCRVRESTN